MADGIQLQDYWILGLCPLSGIQLTSELDPEVMVCVPACLEQFLVATPNGCYSHLKQETHTVLCDIPQRPQRNMLIMGELMDTSGEYTFFLNIEAPDT
jgi:hypothetical protein